MAKITKNELIRLLTKLGVLFDENDNYNDLYKLYLDNKDIIKEVYSYKPDSSEKIIMDISSESLN